MSNMLKNFMHQRHGRLSEELELADAPLGLGKLPKRLIPSGVSRVICGYCSTGCSLDVHIKNSDPINLTPTHDYPVNLGEACPKGWEALTPLKAKDRAIKPLLRNKHGHLEAVRWEVACETFDNW